MKKLLFLSLMVLVLFVSCGNKNAADDSAKTSGEIEKIKKRGVLKVGVFTDKPPFGFINEKNENDGFDIALARQFAKDLLGDENKIEFVPVEAASRVPFLQSDKVDIIMANMTVTLDREKVVDFANPYMKVAIQILGNDKDNVKSVNDLKGKKLIVNKGTTADIFFTKNYPDIELLRFDHNTEAFQALKDGRGAALAHDSLLLYAWAKTNPGFTIVNEKLEEPSPIAPAVKKGNNELREWINNELTELGKQNYLHKIYDEKLKDIFGDAVSSPDEVVTEGGILK
ncbi:transporter substrate-binding domain-containing protein [Sebaldella sp. S0638]|uniref:transporter substrate-binding domain-containing protein n=1 Tax=Sebaldella sp. S0638 TaxID=2957809 RepID=UPI00209ED7E1|nr:transporter substrate-binding domain-containing protein [Sebaldella sp. S0638]MCP1225548.1 transporter substrate-binding domain-containing protein [Sebaldella sp. S0638]